ncbi:MAG: SDR family NAD(P)-dependent oxidoreductase [Rhizobiales bacterium]|nr:SDR family NAD(P)-dependent oxidoreductase [Hyphomicrobiales bacterium]MBO6698422.1 SDR family NAD(P)-dependent oxidoreductase [Hyphomicrobiales bacterium]MBO6735324.1 SDR family NAD(P)-dependent oxidoreductase [Hyphomicrobiales bacterium]MBO6910868.1 SDR family NAD(P)-dependent oxidoreductase [Hyphomicrobiales bacterium]MBO6955924.1 SDR family NAD(P)-dependent oxidoreductase [Hyphomicrobiales bacterium]
MASPLVWITGASSGLGHALALEMAGRGYRLVLTARKRDALEELKTEITSKHTGADVHVAEGDIVDAERMQAIIEGMEGEGGIDIAVLNAGIYIPVDATNPDLDAFHKTFDVNLKGTANCVVPLIEMMKPKGKGQIALVASVAGYSGLPMSSAYGATKAGLINMAEALRFDTDRMGITLQVINPGFVETPATDDNPFEMPFVLKVDDAARRMADGLESRRFEVTFPKRFTYQLKFLRLLPFDIYHWLVSRATGWKGKPLEGDVQS